MPFKYYQKVAKKLTLILGKKTQYQINVYNLTCLASLLTEVSPARWKNRTQKSCSARQTGSSSLRILSMICKHKAYDEYRSLKFTDIKYEIFCNTYIFQLLIIYAFQLAFSSNL